MTFQELLEEVKKHPLQELRAHSPSYFEAVVPVTKLVYVENTLINHFGMPLKPAGLMPSGDAAVLSKPYGGIRKDQTMYFRKQDMGHEVAFLWPWGCQSLVTIKIILEEKKNTDKGPENRHFNLRVFLKGLLGLKR